MDAKVAHLETTRDLSRTWLTVDMDAFFAACEELDNPALVRGPTRDMCSECYMLCTSYASMPCTPVALQVSSCVPCIGVNVVLDLQKSLLH